jgi:PAS domain S-box-containing protein
MPHSDPPEHADGPEAALRAALDRERALIDSLPGFVWSKDAAARYVAVNAALAAACGLPREAMLGRTDEELFPADSARLYRESDDQVLRTGERLVTEAPMLRRDGTTTWFETTKAPVRDRDGRIVGTVGTVRDLTASRAVERTVREREAQLAAIVDRSPIGIALADLDGTILFGNAALCCILGCDTGALGALTLHEIADDGTDAAYRTVFAELLAGARDQYRAERRFSRPSGEAIGALTAAIVRDAAGNPLYVLALLEDVTERARADAAQRQREAQLRAIFDGSAIGMTVVDPDGRIVETNRALQQMLGYTAEELRGLPSAALSPPEDAAATREPVRELKARLRTSATVEKRYVRKDGEVISTLLTVSSIDDGQGVTGLVGMTQDVTAHKALEEQLRHTQKMDALGRLAGGVAHDFNNLLGIISGSIGFLLEALPTGSTERADAEQVQHATDRAAALTRQLLAFSRKQVVQPQVLDLADAIHDVGQLLRRVLGEHVLLTTEVSADVGRVCIDPGQLDQVLVNLAVNARDAMPGGGCVTLRVRREPPCPAVPDAPPQVRIEVADAGTGMDEATRSRATEPFFTTKEPGKGTGLGLATVHGIVVQAGGTLTIDSAPGRGTVVTILLPAIEEAPVAPASPAPAAAARGAGTVLVVEDEPLLRRTTRRILEADGYTVVDAADGVEALEHWAARALRPIDALVTDVVMPRLGGLALAERVRADDPALPMLLVSGYVADEALAGGTLPGGVIFLDKPFTGTALREALQRARAWAASYADGPGSAPAR